MLLVRELQHMLQIVFFIYWMPFNKYVLILMNLELKAAEFYCLKADILKILNTLSPSLQKQAAFSANIKYTMTITLEILQKLTAVATPKKFQGVLLPTKSFHPHYQKIFSHFTGLSMAREITVIKRWNKMKTQDTR